MSYGRITRKPNIGDNVFRITFRFFRNMPLTGIGESITVEKVENVFTVISHTPKGFHIRNETQRVWCSDTTRYVHLTLPDAYEAAYQRAICRMRYAEDELEKAKSILHIAKILRDENS